MRKDIFELGPKRKVYQYILKHPGLHFRELSRKLNIPKTTLDYHLNSLKKRELISVKFADNRNRYFVNNGMGVKDKQFISVMRKKIPRRILLLLCLEDLSQIEIVKYEKKWPEMLGDIGFSIGKHPTTVSFHLDKLIKMGIVGSRSEGNKIIYSIIDPVPFYDFLVRYEGSFFDQVVSPFLKWTNRYSVTGPAFDRILDKLFEILPHPYHA